MADRAFIFDMDGVLIDSEGAWLVYQKDFSTNLFGRELYDKIGSTVGLSIDTIYENAKKHGFSMDKTKYYEIYDKQAAIIYEAAQPTPDIHQLINYLRAKQFKLGLVSSSRGAWINLALKKLGLEDAFDFILSLNDTKTIPPKPHPDGYLAAMKALDVLPNETIILEDSNFGIASATKSGAHTIGYTEHLLPDYRQEGAHAQAHNVHRVIELLQDRA